MSRSTRARREETRDESRVALLSSSHRTRQREYIVVHHNEKQERTEAQDTQAIYMHPGTQVASRTPIRYRHTTPHTTTLYKSSIDHAAATAASIHHPLLSAGRRPQPASRWRAGATHVYLRPPLAVATAPTHTPPQPPLPAGATLTLVHK
eukprot:scaffold5583_cov106-Isochrysis_galbana.AAC.4